MAAAGNTAWTEHCKRWTTGKVWATAHLGMREEVKTEEVAATGDATDAKMTPAPAKRVWTSAYLGMKDESAREIPIVSKIDTVAFKPTPSVPSRKPDGTPSDGLEELTKITVPVLSALPRFDPIDIEKMGKGPPVLLVKEPDAKKQRIENLEVKESKSMALGEDGDEWDIVRPDREEKKH